MRNYKSKSLSTTVSLTPVIAKPCKRLWQSVFFQGEYGFFHAYHSCGAQKLFSLGARTTFDRGASFCSLLPAPQALATSLRMTSRLVATSVTGCAVNCRSVIAVRVSGGHLCKAEAPTEPAGETAARRAAIRFFFLNPRNRKALIPRKALRRY